MDERHSLDRLRDIVVPEAPPIWPPAPEFWLLLFTLLFAVFIVVFQWRRARRANAYRRAGLALLPGADTVHEISVILKRVALAAFPREQVASLYGDEWLAFLRATGGRHDFQPLIELAPDTPADRATKRLAATWIRHHRIPTGTGES